MALQEGSMRLQKQLMLHVNQSPLAENPELNLNTLTLHRSPIALNPKSPARSLWTGPAPSEGWPSD